MDFTARAHAMITATLGALFLVYYGLWLGRPEPAFETPHWLVYGQLIWGLFSFGMIFLYEKLGRSPVLPALYVTDTAATYSFVWYLGTIHGDVLDAFVPFWWKLIAAIVGLILLAEGWRQARRSSGA